jgi:hypothetical protein
VAGRYFSMLHFLKSCRSLVVCILKIKHEYFDNPREEDETEGNKKFQIDNTSIGKTDFQSINLSSFTEIKILFLWHKTLLLVAGRYFSMLHFLKSCRSLVVC